MPAGDTLAADAARPSPGLTIDLDFAGHAAIRLTASALSCRVRDFGDPWPTPGSPAIELDEPG